MLKFRFLALIAALLTLLASCSKNENSRKGDSKLGFIDIKDAKSLFISSDGTSTKLYGVRNNISGKAVSANSGEVYEIKYINEAGDTIQKNNPSYIYNLKNFIVLTFEESFSSRESYFVRKENGKVFRIPEGFDPHSIMSKYSWDKRYVLVMDKIQEDNNDNVYYTTYQYSSPHKKTLYKISLKTPSSLQFEEVSAVNDDIYGYCVDANGNILYSAGYQFDNKMRFREAANGQFHVSDDFYKLFYVWRGNDGKLYGIKHSYGPEYGQGLSVGKVSFVKILNNGDLQEFISYSSDVNTQDYYFFSSMCSDNNKSGFDNFFFVKNNIIFSSAGSLLNLSNEQSFGVIPCNITANIVIEDNLYNFNENTFTCTSIDIATGNTSVLYNLDKSKLNNFDIDKIVKISLDGITFSGIDLRNGKYVVVEISKSNVVTVLSEISGTITCIQAIN